MTYHNKQCCICRVGVLAYYSRRRKNRGFFRERRRIHVINPKLAADRAIEDTHAQGETGEVDPQ